MQRIGEIASVGFVYSCTVKRRDGGAWVAEVRAYDVAEKGTYFAAARCGSGCAGSELATRAASAAAKLLSAGKMSYLKVSSDPAGARIQIGDLLMGVTPALVGVSPGKHTVVVSKAGYHMALKDVDIAPGATGPVYVHLERGSAGDAAGSTRLLRILGWVGVGVGAATLGVGITMSAVGPTGGDPAPGQPVPTQRTSLRAPGIALTVAGGALAAAGIVALILDARSAGDSKRKSAAPATRWSASVGPRHAFLGVCTRF